MVSGLLHGTNDSSLCIPVNAPESCRELRRLSQNTKYRD